MNRRMLFLDLDGTLLNDRKQVTPGNRRALEETLERGHGVVIATGRPLKSAMIQARELGLDKPGCFLIAYNGAAIYDWEKHAQIDSNPLEFATALEVFDYVNQKGFYIQTYDQENVVVERRCDNAILRQYCAEAGIGFRVIADVHTDLTEAPVKILVIEPEDREALEELQRQLQEKMGGRIDSFFSTDTYLEIVRAGMNKGEAVKKLCALLNVPMENTIAAGDAANDLSMIRAAGIGVVMANGTEEVKAAADYVTRRDNNHDGIAEIVELFLQ